MTKQSADAPCHRLAIRLRCKMRMKNRGCWVIALQCESHLTFCLPFLAVWTTKGSIAGLYETAAQSQARDNSDDSFFVSPLLRLFFCCCCFCSLGLVCGRRLSLFQTELYLSSLSLVAHSLCHSQTYSIPSSFPLLFLCVSASTQFPSSSTCWPCAECL